MGPGSFTFYQLTAIMSQVLQVYLYPGPDPPPGTVPEPFVRQSGSSLAVFRCVGVIPGERITVVLASVPPMNKAVVGTGHDGVIVSLGTPGQPYVCLVLAQSDPNVWTIRARTDKDPAGVGVTFTSGTG